MSHCFYTPNNERLTRRTNDNIITKSLPTFPRQNLLSSGPHHLHSYSLTKISNKKKTVSRESSSSQLEPSTNISSRLLQQSTNKDTDSSKSSWEYHINDSKNLNISTQVQDSLKKKFNLRNKESHISRKALNIQKEVEFLTNKNGTSNEDQEFHLINPPAPRQLSVFTKDKLESSVGSRIEDMSSPSRKPIDGPLNINDCNKPLDSDELQLFAPSNNSDTSIIEESASFSSDTLGDNPTDNEFNLLSELDIHSIRLGNISSPNITESDEYTTNSNRNNQANIINSIYNKSNSHHSRNKPIKALIPPIVPNIIDLKPRKKNFRSRATSSYTPSQSSTSISRRESYFEHNSEFTTSTSNYNTPYTNDHSYTPLPRLSTNYYITSEGVSGTFMNAINEHFEPNMRSSILLRQRDSFYPPVPYFPTFYEEFRMHQNQFSNFNPESEVEYKGLASRLLEVMPIENYDPTIKTNELLRSCGICRMEYETGESLRRLPCCHAFHKSCIDIWLEEHTNCPFCRFDVKKGISMIENLDFNY